MSVEANEIQALARENVKKLSPYSSARDEFKGIQDHVFLDANESPFANGFNRYPQPQPPQLLDQLSSIRKVATEKILIGNGSDEILDLLYRAFCEPGEDSVVYMPPTYGMYKVLAGINNVKAKELPLQAGFRLPLEEIKKVVDDNPTGLKMLLFCSPNNPTGHSFPVEEIEQILAIFPGLVVIDEAYIDFSSQASWLERLSEFSRLVVTQTFSKAWGMAGLRLGIAYAHPEIIGLLKRIKPPYNIDSLSQKQASDQLASWDGIQRQVSEVLQERSVLAQALAQFSFVEEVFPTDANFILIRVDDAQRRYDELLERGVVVRNRSKEHGCENCLRITVGTPPENKQLLDTLKQMQST